MFVSYELYKWQHLSESCSLLSSINQLQPQLKKIFKHQLPKP